MAIGLNTAGTWVAANATTQTVTLPTHATGNMLLVRVGFKHATMPTTVTCGTAGWNKIGEANSGTAASSNGGGSVQVAVFWKVATSGAETDPVITFNAGAVAATPSAAVASSYSKAAGEVWDSPLGAGGTIAAATSMSATMGSHIATATGDLVEVAIITNDNTTLTVPTVTQTGVTFAAVVESPAAALTSATSNDIAADGCYRIASSGTSSAAAVVTGTNSVADEGIAWTTRLRVTTADPQLVTPTTAALVTAPFAPTITVSDNQLVTPTTASLVTAPFAPTVTATAHQTVTPDIASLTTAAFAPVVTASDHQSVTPTTASLSLSTFAPTVTATAGTTVTPDTATLTTSAFAPVVTATDHQLVTPGTASLSTTAFAPTVTATEHQLVTPTTATLVIDRLIPVVTASDHQSVTPSTASLTLTSFAPNVGQPVEVTPTTVALTLATFAPSVALTDNQLITPAAANLALTSFAPLVTVFGGNVTVTPDPALLVLTTFAPTVTVPLAIIRGSIQPVGGPRGSIAPVGLRGSLSAGAGPSGSVGFGGELEGEIVPQEP
jgi:hypothetical protein